MRTNFRVMEYKDLDPEMVQMCSKSLYGKSDSRANIYLKDSTTFKL